MIIINVLTIGYSNPWNFLGVVIRYVNCQITIIISDKLAIIQLQLKAVLVLLGQ